MTETLASTLFHFPYSKLIFDLWQSIIATATLWPLRSRILAATSAPSDTAPSSEPTRTVSTVNVHIWFIGK